MKNIVRTILTTIILTVKLLYAWGNTGHRIVGKIAENHLTKNSKEQIKKIIGHHDLSRISFWADEIKSDPAWKHAGDWHWCTVPDNENYEKGKHKGLAVEKVKEFTKVLKQENTTIEKKQIALKFLVHIVGDLHQPFHVGNGKDRGGNNIRLKWFGESTRLHTVWDTHLINHQNLSYTELADYLLINKDSKMIENWRADSILVYVHESRDYRKRCYEFSDDDYNWEYKYFYTHKNLLEQRLLQGGVRLSGLLNRIFN